MKSVKKIVASLSVLTLLAVPVLALAQVGTSESWFGGGAVALGSRDLPDTIADIINAVLAFLGVVAVVIILIGGFMWMTAAGNEEKVGKAKKLLIAGIIGIAIILSAFAISKFVIESLVTATGAP